MADNGGISDPNARSQEAVGSVKWMLFSLRSTLPAPLTTEFRNYPRQGEPWLLGIPSARPELCGLNNSKRSWGTNWNYSEQRFSFLFLSCSGVWGGSGGTPSHIFLGFLLLCVLTTIHQQNVHLRQMNVLHRPLELHEDKIQNNCCLQFEFCWWENMSKGCSLIPVASEVKSEQLPSQESFGYHPASPCRARFVFCFLIAEKKFLSLMTIMLLS